MSLKLKVVNGKDLFAVLPTGYHKTVLLLTFYQNYDVRQKRKYAFQLTDIHYITTNLPIIFKFLSIVTGGDLSLDPSTVSLPFAKVTAKKN